MKFGLLVVGHDFEGLQVLHSFDEHRIISGSGRFCPAANGRSDDRRPKVVCELGLCDYGTHHQISRLKAKQQQFRSFL